MSDEQNADPTSAQTTTDLPDIVPREVWRKARIELLKKEKELTRQRDALNAQRRRLPAVEIEKDYTFHGPDGQANLLDLFEGRRQLIIYHFMFAPDWDEGCPVCSFLVDNLGHLSHLHARDTSLALVSRAPLDKLETYRERMGWTLPWYSSHGSDFNHDFHATLDPDVAPVEYNYKTAEELGGIPEHSVEAHGLSAFLRDGDRIFHTYSTFARGVEALLGTYALLDFTALGRQEPWEEPPGRGDARAMGWMRRHDEYGEAPPEA